MPAAVKTAPIPATTQIFDPVTGNEEFEVPAVGPDVWTLTVTDAVTLLLGEGVVDTEGVVDADAEGGADLEIEGVGDGHFGYVTGTITEAEGEGWQVG